MVLNSSPLARIVWTRFQGQHQGRASPFGWISWPGVRPAVFEGHLGEREDVAPHPEGGVLIPLLLIDLMEIIHGPEQHLPGTDGPEIVVIDAAV